MRPVDKPFDLREDLILRDHLALVRTRLANERTLLSYIRSTLYLLVGGLALLQMEGLGRLHGLGIVALCLSAVFVLFGIYRYVTLRRQLNNYYPKEGKGEGR